MFRILALGCVNYSIYIYILVALSTESKSISHRHTGHQPTLIIIEGGSN
jgi:hypothetical protein